MNYGHAQYAASQMKATKTGDRFARKPADEYATYAAIDASITLAALAYGIVATKVARK